MFSVYCHTNKKNGKKYIGITSMLPTRRWNNGEGYVGNKRFYKDIKKYGWDGFTHEIISDGLSRNEAVKMEASLIDKYNTVSDGYNNHPGGRYGKKGNLSPVCNSIKNSIKYFREEFPEIEELDSWYNIFTRADEANAGESDIAERINIYTEAILKKLNFFGRERADDVFPCYEISILGNYLHELSYIFDLERWQENGGDFPTYISYKTAHEKRMQIVLGIA